VVKNKTPKKTRVAVIGFGSQGRAHAVRLRKAGWSVVIGLPSRSASRKVATALKFKVTTPTKAVSDADVVAMMTPDQVSAALLSDLGPVLSHGALTVFAACYPLHFPSAKLPRHVDVVLVAPHGPGNELESGRPVSGFVGVHQDVTGKALRRARSYARDIGLGRLFETTPELETLGDLFGEQTLLCGGLLGLVSKVAGTMMARGVPAENAYFETIGQLEGLARLLRERGVDGFWNAISDCAAAGSAQAAPRMFDRHFDQALDEIWQAIESGKFARKFGRHGRPTSLPSQFSVLRKLERAGKRYKKRAAPKNRP
jgi:ketol-acid reductoisomerase